MIRQGTRGPCALVSALYALIGPLFAGGRRSLG